jgi:DNA-binding GntR family transcriptional regulator
MKAMTPLPAPALNEPTYQRVKRAIVSDLISHGFQPGDHLTIDMLTTRYNVSHMPIREALRQLEGEGILVSLAHKGFRIEAVSGNYISNMYDIRAGLESMLTRRGAQKASYADIEDLAAIHDAYAGSVRNGDSQACVALNIEFHDRLYSIADNPQAVQLLAALTLIVRTVSQSLEPFIGDDRNPIIEEHAAILDAVRRANFDDCDRAIWAHMENARDRLLARMEKTGLL